VYESPDLNFVKQFQSLGWQVTNFDEEANQFCLLLYEFLR
jgi:hypothetical protein